MTLSEFITASDALTKKNKMPDTPSDKLTDMFKLHAGPTGLTFKELVDLVQAAYDGVHDKHKNYKVSDQAKDFADNAGHNSADEVAHNVWTINKKSSKDIMTLAEFIKASDALTKKNKMTNTPHGKLVEMYKLHAGPKGMTYKELVDLCDGALSGLHDKSNKFSTSSQAADYAVRAGHNNEVEMAKHIWTAIKKANSEIMTLSELIRASDALTKKHGMPNTPHGKLTEMYKAHAGPKGLSFVNLVDLLKATTKGNHDD